MITNDELMLTIRLSTEADRFYWDSFVSQNPESSPYHWYGWKNAVEKSYGHKGYYLIAEDQNGEIIGVLPLIGIKFPWGKKTLVSLPYCDYAGPLGDEGVKKALIDEAISLTLKIGAEKLELRFSNKEAWIKNDSPIDSQGAYPKVRMLKNLPSTASELWSEFKPKLRAQIRRPQKEGLKEEIGGGELFNDFYKVFKINMHRLGSPVHDRRWFENLLAQYKENARVGIVRHKDGFPVAGGILLIIGQKVCVPWASSLREYSSIAPNMLLYYQFLTWSIEHGFNQFDFGRSTPGEGTYKFKEQWGSSPHPLFWFVHSRNGKSSTVLSSNSHARERMANLWSNLPIGIANFLGPKIRKYIAL